MNQSQETVNGMSVDVINHLNYLCRVYDDLNRTIVSTKNRLRALNPDADPKHDNILNGRKDKRYKQQGVEQIKARVSRQIKKELAHFPIWTEYMVNVPGIGADIAGKQIMLYYYRFVPICTHCGGNLEKQPTGNGDGDRQSFVCAECGKKAKGEGILKHRIEEKDFPTISGWRHYLGIHCGEDGRKPKKQSGQKCTWSSRGRANCFQIGTQFVKQGPDHRYRQFYDKRRAYRDKTHPDKKGHQNNMARHETAKLFQSHFWQVARTLSGKPVTKPWIIASPLPEHSVHQHMIEPYYWNGKSQGM